MNLIDVSASQEQCVHHYIIPSPIPRKETLTGVCKKCGFKKEHVSFIDYANYKRGWKYNGGTPQRPLNPDLTKPRQDTKE